MTVVSTATLINPGAETGDATGWTADLNTAPVARTTGAHSGTYKFFIANAAVGAYYQDYVLPTEVRSAAGVGAVLFNPYVWQDDFSGDTDSQRFRVHVWNANSEIVQTIRDAIIGDHNGNWTVRSFELPLHTEARVIRLYVDGFRSTGAELSAYQDDFGITFLTNSQYRFDIGLQNPGGYTCTSFAFNPTGGADPANWVVKSGNLDCFRQGKSVQNNLHNVATYFFRGVDSTTFMATQVVCMTNVFSIYDAIDTGSISMILAWLQGAYEGTDPSGKMRVDFMSGSGTQVGSMESGYFLASTRWQRASISGVVPPQTRNFEVSMIYSGSGAGGSSNFSGDCWFTTIEAYMMLNSNYIDGNNDPFAQPPISGQRDFPRVIARAFPTTAQRAFPVLGDLVGE